MNRKLKDRLVLYLLFLINYHDALIGILNYDKFYRGRQLILSQRNKLFPHQCIRNYISTFLINLLKSISFFTTHNTVCTPCFYPTLRHNNYNLTL